MPPMTTFGNTRTLTMVRLTSSADIGRYSIFRRNPAPLLNRMTVIILRRAGLLYIHPPFLETHQRQAVCDGLPSGVFVTLESFCILYKKNKWLKWLWFSLFFPLGFRNTSTAALLKKLHIQILIFSFIINLILHSHSGVSCLSELEDVCRGASGPSPPPQHPKR